MLSNKEFDPIVTELFICGRKRNTSLAFITRSYFAVPNAVPKLLNWILHIIFFAENTTVFTANPQFISYIPTHKVPKTGGL